MSENVADRNDFYREIDVMLKLPAGTVQGNQSLAGLAGWDSLAVIDFMMLASSDYGSDVEPSEIFECQTVDDLAQLTLERSSNVA